MLRRRHLIVLCLGRDPQLPQLLVQILHVRADALPDHTEVVILHLLSLRRRRPEQRASRKLQIRSLHIQIFIHQEILLFRSYGRGHLRRPRIAKQPDDAQRLFAQCLHGAQKRRLLVKSLPRIRAECRRNTEDRPASGFFQKRRRRDVPCRIPSCLKRGEQAARRE